MTEPESLPDRGGAVPTARSLARGSVFVFAFALVPLVAVVELVAHAAIVARVPRPSDWDAARAFIAHEKRDGDLVASAPVWTDPLAREHFASLITLEDAARPDARRYRRAFVATIRHGSHPDFAGWTETRAVSFGAVTVRELRNPHPDALLYDFVAHVRAPDAEVFRGDRSCPFLTGQFVTGGGLGGGALAGPERFSCGDGWNYVGRTIAEDMDHRGRLCIWSHPVVEVPMRTRFANVPLGHTLRGHHVVAYEAERGGDHGEVGAPITLSVSVDGREIGRDVHADGDGWKDFAFATGAGEGARGTVEFAVTVPAGGNRHYCFAAETL